MAKKSCILFLIGMFLTLLSGCALTSVEKRNGTYEVYDADSVLVERSHYVDGVLDGNRWLNFGDTMNVSQLWENGRLVSSDTFYLDPVRNFEILPAEETLVEWGKTISMAGATSTSMLSDGVKIFSSFLGSPVELPKVDSNMFYAFTAGYIRGFSVGLQESEETLKTVVGWVPTAAKAATTTTLADAYDSAKKQVLKTTSDVAAYMNVDSAKVVMELGRKKIEQVPGLADELMSLFQVEIEESMRRWNVPSENLGVFASGYITGWVGWNMLVNKVLDATWCVAVAAKEAFTGNSPRKVADFAARMSRSRSVTNPERAARSFRQPVSGDRGHWHNEKTKNVWKSDLPEVNAITKGRGVHFTGPANNRMPDFTDWSRGTYKFKKGELIGYDEPDFDKLYEKIAARKKISRGEAKRFVQRNGLTPHHSGCNEIQLIPMALHNGVPHTGGASMIRNGLCPK